ncbi:GFA family protein [Cribrihabitans neustonicus]|uniref:GFA family protein n=1 Tax=Cribrihabitans neustonicus TaxID=1429085 RepID=UPI003B59CB80
MSDVLEGRCLCGSVTIRVQGAHDPRPGACHCRMCQRWTGGLFLCFEAEGEAVTVEGPVTLYKSSEFAERAFCGKCGSHLWMRTLKGENPGYDLMPGMFSESLDWPMRSEIYIDRALAAVRLAGDHKRATRAEYEAKNLHVEGDG